MKQDDVIRRLSEGEGFGGIAPERIDTHISTVFLVGDSAYKLKRALTTSYLDYSSLEARHRLCVAELEINRRTAPHIYLDVIPIRLTQDDKLILGEGEGPPVEWLVHMLRFEQGNLFDNLALEGRLTPSLMTDLADEISAFHNKVEIIHDLGAGSRIGSVIDQNALELTEKGSGLIEPAVTDLFEQRCRTALNDVKHIIDQRGAQGFFRRCHGDLHLRNICLIDGKPTLFDAIEFSEDIGTTDVLFDLAFLVMDLEHRGLCAEANMVFNRYLYRIGDIDDLAIFPLYLALRAGIRAHVSAKAATIQKSPKDREILRQDANSYLQLGLKCLDKFPPHLIAIGGLSGTGKSTTACNIAPQIGPRPGALVLSSDLIRKKLLGVEPLTRLAEDAYNSIKDQGVYDGLFESATGILTSGYSVVLDATFIDPAQRQRLPTLAKRTGVSFAGFWLTANPAALRDRLRGRVGDPSDATIPVLERQLEIDIGDIDWQPIDADRSSKAICEKIHRALNSIETGAGQQVSGT